MTHYYLIDVLCGSLAPVRKLITIGALTHDGDLDFINEIDLNNLRAAWTEFPTDMVDFVDSILNEHGNMKVDSYLFNDTVSEFFDIVSMISDMRKKIEIMELDTYV